MVSLNMEREFDRFPSVGDPVRDPGVAVAASTGTAVDSDLMSVFRSSLFPIFPPENRSPGL